MKLRVFWMALLAVVLITGSALASSSIFSTH